MYNYRHPAGRLTVFLRLPRRGVRLNGAGSTRQAAVPINDNRAQWIKEERPGMAGRRKTVKLKISENLVFSRDAA